MSVEVKRLQTKAEADLSGFVSIGKKYLTKRSNQVRKEIEEKTQSSLALFENFFGALKKWKGLEPKLFKAIQEYERLASTDSDAAKDLLVSTRLIRDSYNKAVYQLDKNKGQVSHQEVSVLASYFLIVHTYLVKLLNDGDKFYKTRGSQEEYIDIDKAGSLNTTVRKTKEQFRLLIKEWNMLLVAAVAVAESPNMLKEEPLDQLDKALDNFFKDLTQEKWLIKKEKLIDVTSGKAEQVLAFESQGVKSASEYGLGFVAENLRTFTKQAESEAIQEILNKYKDKFGAIEGSKNLEGQIVKQLTDVATGKKPKRYASKTKLSGTTGKTFKNPIKKPVQKILVGATSTRLTSFPPSVVKKVESGDRTTQSELNKIKRKINQRLSAEVRRNMGRPALINRTGRFSNSVELTSLQGGNKTLVGTYTYLLSPYETFENTGEKQWPAGYNPKLLIAKSIRNLAEQYTDEKFTLRRQ